MDDNIADVRSESPSSRLVEFGKGSPNSSNRAVSHEANVASGTTIESVIHMTVDIESTIAMENIAETVETGAMNTTVSSNSENTDIQLRKPAISPSSTSQNYSTKQKLSRNKAV